MTSRADLAAAQRALHARTGRLSDELLPREHGCFAAIDALWTTRQQTVVRLAAQVAARHPDPDVLTSALAADLQAPLTTLTVTLAAQSLGPVRGLLEEAAQMAVDASGDTLGIVARVDQAPAGLAGLAAAQIAELAHGTVDSAAGLYTQAAARAAGITQARMGEQIGLGRLYGDTAGKRIARLASPANVGRPGCSAAGLFWRTPSMLHSAARAATIGLVNTLRVAAMAQYNDLERRALS